jgi:GT2 family glycosyltransferase
VTVSILTLVRGRRDHLAALMKGLAQQTQRPSELVIAYMQPEVHDDLPDPRCPLRSVHVAGEALPLAAARNAAAAAASGDHLIFLDVDCIPAATLVESYDRALTQQEAVYLSEVFYLPGGAVDHELPAPDYDRLDELGSPHPSKPAVPDTGWRAEPDHGELWGLCFGLRRSTWEGVGGMDDGYTGYGGEETDLAQKLRAANVPAYWIAGARAYHQHHTVHIPPLHHFQAIIRNAERFRERWGSYPMTYWLGQFSDMGLIRMNGGIEVIREPTTAEIAASRAPDTVLFS